MQPDHELSDAEVLERLPGIPITHDTVAHYRAYFARRLLINRCLDCQRWHQPPRAHCPSCWSPRIVPSEVSGRGRVYLDSRIHVGPPAPGVDYASPHPVITVELAEQYGLRFSSTFATAVPDASCIGAPVALAWTSRGDVPWPTFVRVEEAT